MQIIFHLGVHGTDDGRLVKSVLRSRAGFDAARVQVPAPQRYRQLLREALTVLNNSPASTEVQQVLLDALLESDEAERLLLSHDNLICIPQRAVTDEGLYPMAAWKLGAIANIFPDHDVRIHMALCNPATLIPTLAMRVGTDGKDAVLTAPEPERLRWLPTFERLAEHSPDLDMTLWCNEDTPFIWPEVLRSVTGAPAAAALDGDIDLVATLLSEAGLEALKSALKGHDAGDIEGRRQLIGAHLEEFAPPERLDMDIDLPGWTDDIVAEITETYISDCEAIAELPGVTFIQP